MRSYLIHKKNRDLLQYGVEAGDAALICTHNQNHGRLCRVLYLWDELSLMSYDFEEYYGKECFVVSSVGSPFVFEKEGILYKTPSIVVESKNLKRVAHHSKIDWSAWA